MHNKKAVFLFGAGAVIDWGGPFTRCKRDKLETIPEHGSDEIINRPCCLTHLLTGTGFYGKDGERITAKILKALDPDFSNQNLNFETIVNIIEDLYTYWSAKSNKIPTTLYSIANLDSSIEELHFFEHTEPNPATGKYSITIPGNYPPKTDFISDEVQPIQKYFELVLNDSLATIKAQIQKYSYYTSGHNKILNPANEIINKHFRQWMNKLVNQDYTLRMYTLNYDRAFKVLLQTSGLEVFEGFELNGAAVDYNQSIPPNLPRIISDFDSHIHYNLHGSAYWNLKNLNCNGLSGYEFHLVPSGEIDTPAGTITFEKGKQLLLSSIITGYQKVQRTATSPFRQMVSAFDKDCFEADRLYIIGYSFGDEHINDIVRNARKYNSKLEIVLIDPAFNETKFRIEFILHWGNPTGAPYLDTGPKEIISPEFNVKIIKKKFGKFLQDEN